MIGLITAALLVVDVIGTTHLIKEHQRRGQQQLIQHIRKHYPCEPSSHSLPSPCSRRSPSLHQRTPLQDDANSTSHFSLNWPLGAAGTSTK